MDRAFSTRNQAETTLNVSSWVVLKARSGQYHDRYQHKDDKTVFLAHSSITAYFLGVGMRQTRDTCTF